MKWKEILRNDMAKMAVLVNQPNTQFVVAFNYDPEAPEDQQWGHGHYFEYWMNEEKKAEALADAIDLFMCRTDPRYIPRMRLEEIASKSLDELKETDEDSFDDFCEQELDLTEEEKEWFGLNEENE